ncbi:MAG: hypothetical protein IT427_16165 [Pirellulales bacterium]|nr:hypothetical protein [Pirellulales bacterium]
MVVVYGDLFEYFILASQTCDVSGNDGPAKPFAAICPVVTMGEMLARERFPISKESRKDPAKSTTVVDYLQETLQKDFSADRDDPFTLPNRVRDALAEWQPATSSEKETRGRIKNILSESSFKKSYLYYLPADVAFNMPECYVDFTRLFSVVTERVSSIASNRVCTLVSPYREDFGSKLGSYLSRVATPSPLAPPKIQ